MPLRSVDDTHSARYFERLMAYMAFYRTAEFFHPAQKRAIPV